MRPKTQGEKEHAFLDSTEVRAPSPVTDRQPSARLPVCNQFPYFRVITLQPLPGTDRFDSHRPRALRGT